MKLACEIPVKYLNEIYPLMDFPFMIAHYSEIPEYKDFYVEACKNSNYSILDNGSFELGRSVSSFYLMERVKMFNPTHVIAPETRGDRNLTVWQLKEFKHLLETNGLEQKVVGVLQGSSLREYRKCFEDFQEHADLIAATYSFPFEQEILKKNPLIASIKDKTLRKSLIRIKVIQEVLSESSDVNMHLLGMSSPCELSALKDHREIISNDSSSIVQHGLKDIVFTEEGYIEGGKIPQEENFITKVVCDFEEKLPLINANMSIVRKLLEDEELCR